MIIHHPIDFPMKILDFTIENGDFPSFFDGFWMSPRG